MPPLKVVCLAVSVLLTRPAAAWAETVADARRAYFAGQYETARSIAYPLAEEGDAEAQLLMAQMLEEGKAREPNYYQAFRWVKRAADQGDVWGQVTLAIHYANGRGVPKNYAEASRWFRAAALQGNPLAQDQLGRNYALGKGVKQSYVISYAWVSIAAADGRIDYSAKSLELLTKVLSPTEIAEAQRMAAACYNSGYTACNW